MSWYQSVLDVVRRLLAAMGQQAREDAENQQLQLVSEHYKLEDAVWSAWNRDLGEFKQFTGTVFATLSPVVHLAEAACRAVHEENLKNIGQQRAELEKFQQVLQDAIRQLAADRLRWEQTAHVLNSLEQQVKALNTGKGWTGVASTNYGSIAGASGQGAATINGAAVDLPHALSTVSVANQAAAERVRGAIQAASGALGEPVRAFGTFHRTRSVSWHLANIAKHLTAATGGELTQGQADTLNKKASDELAKLQTMRP